MYIYIHTTLVDTYTQKEKLRPASLIISFQSSSGNWGRAFNSLESSSDTYSYIRVYDSDGCGA